MKLNLSKYNNRFRKLVQEDIYKKDLIKTGDLIRSIDAEFRVENDNVVIEIGSIYYYEYLDNGTRHIKARKITEDVIKSKEFQKIMDEVTQEWVEYQLSKI